MRSSFPDIPIYGGTVVSGAGNWASFFLLADANGTVSLPFTGAPNLVDLVIQPLFIDPTQAQGTAFGEAFLASFGQ